MSGKWTGVSPWLTVSAEIIVLSEQCTVARDDLPSGEAPLSPLSLPACLRHESPFDTGSDYTYLRLI